MFLSKAHIQKFFVFKYFNVVPMFETSKMLICSIQPLALLYKSASGCLEHINIFEVSNINTTLKYLKTKNFWICGFDKNGSKDFTNHDWNGNNVLLFGSEGYGLKYQTLNNSDFLLKIHINKKIESLNISNSAAVVFHYINNLRKNN